MNPKRRIYSLPYNGTNPVWFLQEVEKRKQNIDHVYCELPFKEMISHVRFTFDDKKTAGENPADVDAMRALYLKNCFEFLRLSKGKVRRICPVNAMCYPFVAEDEVKNFVVMLARAAKELQLEGFILSDYRVAALLHALPTSGICGKWKSGGRNVARPYSTPPREILRTPSRLKEMHDAGFRLKCLVNEACLMGCPNSFNHNLSIAMGRRPVLLSCCQNGVADLFRANWIYKIAGRNTEGDYPFKTLDAYLAEDDSMPLAELMISGTVLFATHMLPAEILRKITIDKAPDKLLTCECRECERCGLCERILSEIIPEKYRESFRFKIKVT